MTAVSNSECRFVGKENPSQDYNGDLTQPGRTGAPIAFVGGSLLAGVALLLLREARREEPVRPPRVAWACAIAVFPLAFVELVYDVVKPAFACGTGFL